MMTPLDVLKWCRPWPGRPVDWLVSMAFCVAGNLWLTSGVPWYKSLLIMSSWSFSVGVAVVLLGIWIRERVALRRLRRGLPDVEAEADG